MLRLAARRSGHVALAGGRGVLAAGEITFVPVKNGWYVTEVTKPVDWILPRSRLLARRG